MSTLIIYHQSCQDGFCSAWLLHHAYPDAEFVACKYGDSPPDVTGKDVIIADFSFKRPVMGELAHKCKSLVVLDHHETAEKELAGFEKEFNYLDVHVEFDMKKSGAMLTWDWLIEQDLISDLENIGAFGLVEYVQDRDLWNWKLQDSKEINSALASYPQTYEQWDELASRKLVTLAVEGEAILRREKQIIAHHVRNATEGEMFGCRVPIVNCTALISEVGNDLAIGQPFAAMWQVVGNKKIWSLRSAPDGLNVADLAKSRGGGGHKSAAGFTEELMC